MNKLPFPMPVNWVDGMKINKQHFIQSQKATLHKMSAYYHLKQNDFQYGLVLTDKETALSWTIKEEKIILEYASLVTKNGFLATYDGTYCPPVSFTLSELLQEFPKAEGQSYYVIITVNPYVYQAIGIPTPDELPPRQPYTNSLFNLEVVPLDQVSSADFAAYHLPIGKISIQSGQMRIDNQYIPPSSTVASHPELKTSFLHFGKLLQNIELNALEVTHRAAEKRQVGQINHLAESILHFAEAVQIFTLNNNTKFDWFLAKQAPVFMVEFFVRFAKTIHNNWQYLKKRDKEEMLNYFHDHTGYAPSVLEQQNKRIIQLSYQHFDIQPTIAAIVDFLARIDRLFSKLVQLEYIPKSDHTMIVREGAISQPASSSGSIFR